MAVTPATPWRKVREGSYLKAKEEGQSYIILGRRGSDVPVEYAMDVPRRQLEMPGWPPGRAVAGIHVSEPLAQS